MTGVFKFTKQDEIEAEITIRATVGEFRAIRQALEGEYKWPVSDFKMVLADVIRKAEDTFITVKKS